MRIGLHTNGISCEYRMQDVLAEWLQEKGLLFNKEARVKEVSRIADFLVLRKGRLINIEAKCNDFTCMLKQLDDHRNVLRLLFRLYTRLLSYSRMV